MHAKCVRMAFEFGSVPHSQTVLRHFEDDGPVHEGETCSLTVREGVVSGMEKAILRYAGRLGRTHPSDPEVALHIDEWVELNTEFRSILAVGRTPERYGLGAHTEASEREHRQWVEEDHIPFYIELIEGCVGEGEGEGRWLAGVDAVSIADFCWACSLRWMADEHPDSLLPFPAARAYLLRVEEEVASKGAE